MLTMSPFQAYLIEGGVLPDGNSEAENVGDPWLEIWDKLNQSIKKSFGRPLNDNDVKEAKNAPGGWEGDHTLYS